MFTEIKSKSIGDAWKSLLSNILEKGQETKDGDQIIKELCNVIVSLDHDVRLTDPIFEKYYDKKWISFMRANFFDREPINDWGYSYGQRFFNYEGNNQIKDIIDKLRKNPLAKSATVSLAYPPGDKKHMPCIFCSDFKIRDGMLNITSYFRSKDAGKKFCADVICLKEIQEMVSKEVGVKSGNFYLICSSMHIYEPEFKQAKLICQNEQGQ